MTGNVEEAIAEAGRPVQLLWNPQGPGAVVPRVVPEFRNRRDERLASWRTVVLGVELGFAAA